MAIAFARISYHSRTRGHSAVAGAAYRAGEALFDQRTGELHDFQNRKDVIYSNLLLPDGAHQKFNDRALLWNTVEAAERRSNSQVAKDIILALPRDLDLSHHIHLAEHFAHYHFVRYGIVADIAIHDHGEGNPHAHLYVTTRRLIGDRFEKYKARDLEPDVVRGRVVDPQYWGEQWRDFQNDYFQDQDLDLQVDANYLIAQRHEGRVRGHEAHYLREENALRREASIDIALNNPHSVLNHLGSQHAVFSERDIALLIHKNTHTKEAYEAALSSLKAHRDLIFLGPGDDGRDRYTTRANYLKEATLSDQATVLHQHHAHPVRSASVQEAVKTFKLNSEQADALSHITQCGAIGAIVGRAGTGKSYMMKAARHVWEASGYRIRGMAVSGIASKGLETGSGIPSTTIYALKMQIASGLMLESHDILVMDEAGMTDLNDMAFMVDVTKKTGAKLVLIGDHAQLQPVGPGAPFRALVEHIGFAELNRIQRQEQAGDCSASVLLSRGMIDQAIDYYAQEQRIHLIMPAEEDEDDGGSGDTGAAMRQLVEHWFGGLTHENISERLILAHRKIDVAELNRRARASLRQRGYLTQTSHTFQTSHGTIELSVGDRILCLRNHRALRLSNGEFATVLKIMGDQITVRMDQPSGQSVTFSTQTYPDFSYGYAATVHKSQGATFDHTFVYVAGRSWNRFLSYVAMTRHRKTLNVYANKQQFKNLATLKSTLSRSGLKDSVLDWPLSYAIRRGFDPERLLGRFINSVLVVREKIYDRWTFVTNYARFKEKQRSTHVLKTKALQRERAKKIALFVDLNQGLAAQARHMRQELSSNEKFHHHHDYGQWFAQTLLRNQLAFEIKQVHPLYENALSLNHIRLGTLDQWAIKHQRAMKVSAYLNDSHAKKSTDDYLIATELHSHLSDYFPYIAYQAEQRNITIEHIIDKIKRDAKQQECTRACASDKNKSSFKDEQAFQQTSNAVEATSQKPTSSSKKQSDSSKETTYETEWHQLSSIKSPAINRVMLAKSRLDNASEPLHKEIQTRAYENAIKQLINQDRLFERVKQITPQLAKLFEAIDKPKSIRIDWLSPKYDAEFESLKQTQDSTIQQFVTLRDQLIHVKGTPRERFFIKQLESTGYNMMRYEKRQKTLRQKAPILAERLLKFVKFKNKEKSKNRDL